MSVPEPIRRIAAGLLVLLPIACGPREEHRVDQPSMSPDEVARRALDEFDTNKDGFLSGEELDRCPALKNSMDWLDRDKDGKLSADEIAERIREYQKSKIGLMAVNCQVTLDGRIVQGATVTLVPEPFMGPAVKPATGVTDATGTVVPAVSPGQPGANLGFYKIEVSLKDADGKELMPARFNTQTVLGQEVGPRMSNMRGGIKLVLTSQ